MLIGKANRGSTETNCPSLAKKEKKKTLSMATDDRMEIVRRQRKDVL